MSFRLQLATLPLMAGPFEPLSFATLRQGGNAAGRPFNPVLAATVGSELEYGNLFAYLFRRFGYPNQAWDHSTDLAHYLLTTPRRDLFLSVVPRIDGRCDQSIEFLAPLAAADAAAAYARSAIDAWEGRAIMHWEARGMPRWLRARALSLTSSERAAKGQSGHTVEAWREALRVTPADGKVRIRQEQTFLRQSQDAYACVETKPPVLQRAVMLKDWAETDPLKPYAVAAARALAALTRAVRVGTHAIDVFGPKSNTCRALAAPASIAPSLGGHLNRQSARMAELLQLIESLGQNDLRRGIPRAIAILKRERTS